jgi:hypothetical protein
MGQAATGVRDGPARLELNPATEKLGARGRLTLPGEWQRIRQENLTAAINEQAMNHRTARGGSRFAPAADR